MKIFILFLPMIFFCLNVRAQEVHEMTRSRHARTENTEVAISQNIRIHPNPSMQQFETSISTHPSDPNIVLVSAVTQDTTALMEGTMGWYYTTNGGATWVGRDTMSTHTNLSHWMDDPTVAIDGSGNLFVGGIYNDDHVFVDRSTDGGSTWNHVPTYSPPSGYHRPHLTVDTNPGSPYQGQLSIASTSVLFSRSSNGGQTFSGPLSISGTIGSWRRLGPRLATGPNGELYATWAGYDASSGQPIRLGFNRSTDGGANWDTPKSIRSFKGVHPTFKNVQLFTAPSVAVDPMTGSIYVVYDERNPTTPDIFLIRSTDGGTTWSDSIKVNQDNSGRDQWMPTICVDPSTGNIFVVYYDSRNFSGNDSAQVYVSASTNGGNSFQDILVSDVPFLPAPIRASWDDDYMTQYIGIAALDNVVWPCWNDNRTGFHQVYVSRIEFPPVSVAERVDESTPASFGLNQNYPNPFNPSTTIEFQVPEVGSRRSEIRRVTLRVYNALGQEVATLVNEELRPGSYQATWDASGFPSGTYFYRLQAGELAETKKLILLR